MPEQVGEQTHKAMHKLEKQIYDQAVIDRRKALKVLNESGWKDGVKIELHNYFDFDSMKPTVIETWFDLTLPDGNYQITFEGTFDFAQTDGGLNERGERETDIRIFGITGKVEVCTPDEQVFVFTVVDGDVVC